MKTVMIHAASGYTGRMAAGEFRAGFQTLVGLFGSGFAETIADTRIVDPAMR